MLARYTRGARRRYASAGRSNSATTSTDRRQLAALAPNTVVWGFIDMMQSTAGDHSLPTCGRRSTVDRDRRRGIFCADYDYNFG